jgi:hypothetical protein
MERRLDGPQNRSGHGGEEKNSQPPPRVEPPTIQPVAQRYTTELSRIYNKGGHDRNKGGMKWTMKYGKYKPT